MVEMSELRARVGPGYNLAVLLDSPPVDAEEALAVLLDRGLPVLKEAKGALGVLRSLDFPGRMPGIQEELAYSGEEAFLLHLMFLEDAAAAGVLHWYKFRVTAE